MTQEHVNVSSVTSNDDLSHEKGDGPTRTLGIDFTDFQNQQLEKAFKKDEDLDVADSEAIALNIEPSMKEVQGWFPHQQENQITIESTSYSHLEQTGQPMEVNSSDENDNSEEETVRLIEETFEKWTSEKNELADLKENYSELLSKYNNLLSDKNKITQEFTKKLLKNHQLNRKIRKLTQEMTRLRNFRDRIRRAHKKYMSIRRLHDNQQTIKCL